MYPNNVTRPFCFSIEGMRISVAGKVSGTCSPIATVPPRISTDDAILAWSKRIALYHDGQIIYRRYNSIVCLDQFVETVAEAHPHVSWARWNFDCVLSIR